MTRKQPRPRRGILTAIALGLTAALSLTLTGCIPQLFPQATRDSTPTNEQVSAIEAPYYHQVVHWKTCWSEFECATVKAPIDWADPGKGEISLALIQHRAKVEQPLGDLLVNPGGPGASGVSFIRDSFNRATTETVSDVYNVIGFDPRGVGSSTPVTCFASDAETDDFLYGITQGTRGSAEWQSNREDAAGAFIGACEKNTGELLNHLSTADAAHDMDMLRAALGQQQLDYLGYSYGTELGAIYADMFPSKVGRMVLDGAVDPTVTRAQVTVIQAEGFETALRNYVTWCLQRDDCPLSGSVDQALQQISSLLQAVDQNPVAAKDGRMLGADTLLTAIALPLYSKDSWDFLSSVLADTLSGAAEVAFQSADIYNERDGDGNYSSNSTEAFIAIGCADKVAETDPTKIQEQLVELHQVAPVLGEYFGYGDALCANWPQSAVPKAERLGITATGSPDILVVGTIFDPATPYRWAVALAGQLPQGHLITYQGDGHTAYGQASTCINSVVDEFFLTGVVPATDPNCPAVSVG